jgi:methyltransferase
MPHHLRKDEWCPYREGITYRDEEETTDLGENAGKKKKKWKGERVVETKVDTGLAEPVSLPFDIPPNTRITLRFPEENSTAGAEAVAPNAPREEGGYYWGYTVRRCSSISTVFTECGFEGGYDVSFGTSERGQPLSELLPTGVKHKSPVPKFEHMIVVFGGLAGLEAAVRVDSELQDKGVTEAKELFDFWVDICPGQGSRTIRTEEAVWIGLMGLRGIVQDNYHR